MLELGAGQGRDALYLACQGLQVTALDVAPGTMETISAKARSAGLVHFFDRPLIDRLAGGFELIDVADFAGGDLPRRLVRVTMRVPQR